ncbi:MAG: FMN-binding protein [Candidatus Paceibacterota bacterium]
MRTPHQKHLSSAKVHLAVVLVVVSTAYAVWHFFVSETPPPALTTAPAQPTTEVATTSDPVVDTEATGLYNNGSFVGPVIDAFYGVVQVEAVIRSGALAEVKFLQYPSDRDTSRIVNDEAMPILIQEALRAQSAQVATVSGATFTSEAFQQSIAAALAQAEK